MNMSGRRILKTTAAVVGIGALGALGSGTAFAATPTDLGDAPNSHGTGTADAAGLATPASSKSGDLHTFAMPKMATHVAEPSTRYDDNSDDNSDSSDDRDNSDNSDSSDDRDSNSRYDDNNDNNYDDNGYDNNDDNGYYDDGYRHNDGGLLGGGLLGGNN